MGYSEKELLMLSNFAYLDASTENGTISEILSEYRAPDGTFTPESVKNAGTGGGLSGEEVSELFTQMQEQCDKPGSDFGNLSAARRLEEYDVRGILYSNETDKNPVIVFRGTGGTKEAWQDNMYGGFKTDTRIQKTADDFVRYECGTYDNITVTGHSKGGNLSQYVTVMNSDRISSCVSFDGQGMSDDFIRANAEALTASSPKIKSICAYNDFVNILLTSIAGTVLYVKNSEGGANAHSSFYLLTSNEYDENGNFVSQRGQSEIAKSMKRTVDRIVDALKLGNYEDNIILGGILGEMVSTLLGSEDAEEAVGGVKQAANEMMLAFTLKMDALVDDTAIEIASLPSGGIFFDHDNVKISACAFDDARLKSNECIQKTEEVIENMDINIASRLYTDLALNGALDDMRKNSERMREILDIMNVSLKKYEEQESMTALRMRSEAS